MDGQKVIMWIEEVLESFSDFEVKWRFENRFRSNLRVIGINFKILKVIGESINKQVNMMDLENQVDVITMLNYEGCFEYQYLSYYLLRKNRMLLKVFSGDKLLQLRPMSSSVFLSDYYAKCILYKSIINGDIMVFELKKLMDSNSEIDIRIALMTLFRLHDNLDVIEKAAKIAEYVYESSSRSGSNIVLNARRMLGERMFQKSCIKNS